MILLLFYSFCQQIFTQLPSHKRLLDKQEKMTFSVEFQLSYLPFNYSVIHVHDIGHSHLFVKGPGPFQFSIEDPF